MLTVNIVLFVLKVASVTTGETDGGVGGLDLGDVGVRLDGGASQTSVVSSLRTESHHAMTTLRVWAKLEGIDLDFKCRRIW